MVRKVDLALYIRPSDISLEEIYEIMNIKDAKITREGEEITPHTPIKRRTNWVYYTDDKEYKTVNDAWRDFSLEIIDKAEILIGALIRCKSEIHVIFWDSDPPSDIMVPGGLIKFSKDSGCTLSLFWYKD